jgi:hypothetical protein
MHRSPEARGFIDIGLAKKTAAMAAPQKQNQIGD